MRRALAALAIILALSASAQEPAPLLFQVTVAPAGPVWVGQRVTLTLTALTLVRFATPPAFPDLAGLPRLIVLPEATTVPGTIRVGGTSYAALQRSVAVFPTEAGEIALPSLTLHASVGGPDGRPMDAQATAQAPPIMARVPAGVADLKRLIVAPVFRLSATTDRAPEGLRVGEAITRSIRMEAEDTAAMLVPPALWGAPDGVAVYPEPPVLQDRTDRGTLHAGRGERAAYVPRRPGTFELPGFSVAWLRSGSDAVQTVTVPPIRLEVLPAATAPQPRRRGWTIAAAAAGVSLLAGLAVLLWRRSRRPSLPEARAFAALEAACRHGDAAPAYAALLKWCHAAHPDRRDDSPQAIAHAAAVPALTDTAAALERHLYAGETGRWRGDALLATARAARHALRRPPTATPCLPCRPLIPCRPVPPPDITEGYRGLLLCPAACSPPSSWRRRRVSPRQGTAADPRPSAAMAQGIPLT